MELRIFTEPQQGASYDDLLAVAKATETLGFDGFFRSDHYLRMGDGDPLPGPTDAWTTLAGLARETSRIRLGTLVSSPNYRHPVTFMRDLLALDDISGGRIICGLGTGGDVDARLLGEAHTVRERVDRFHEFTALLDRLLREDHVDHAGDHYRAVDARTGVALGAVGQGSRLFVRSAENDGQIRVEWGTRADQQCVVDYGIPAAQRSGTGYVALTGTCRAATLTPNVLGPQAERAGGR